MKHLLREYGFIALLVLTGAGAYFLYESRGGELVESSLESIASRLDRMVGHAEGKDEVSDAFASFREKVERGEITSEQLDRVAANVIHMSEAGSHMTPAEAKTLLELAVLDVDSLIAALKAEHAVHPPTPPSPPVVHPPSNETSDAMTALNRDILAQIRSLRDKGYRPPENLDSMLQALDARIERVVDSALSTARDAGRQSGH